MDSLNKEKVSDGFQALEKCITFSKNKGILSTENLHELIEFIHQLQKLVFELIAQKTEWEGKK